MAIQLFQPTYRTIQNPVDLNVLANTYNTLEAKHIQGVEMESAYREALNKLDLNEAEDAWLAQRQIEIQDAFNNNLKFGNAAGAIDDIRRTYGNIMADAGMKGRLRAQQDYKTYLTNLENNKTLDEDTKDYYRQKNKYYYQDKVDNNGNVIGGTKWIPEEREVDTIPLALIFEQARKWAAEDSGASDSVMFLDANGKPTPNYQDSVTGHMHVKVGTEWKRLDDNKVRAAIDAAIKSMPGAQASLDQDYKIAKWKYENGRTSDVLDKNGKIMAPEEYLENRINPFIQAVTYHNRDTKVNYGSAWQAQLAYNQKLSGGVGAGGNYNSRYGDIPSYRSNLVTVKNNAPVEAQAAITANRQSLSNLLQKHNPDLNLNLVEADDKTIYDAIVANIKDPEDLASAISDYHDIIDNRDYITSITKGKDPDDTSKFETYNAITSMSDLPDNNFSKTYSDISNYIYNGSNKIRQYLSEDEYNNFIVSIGDSNLNKYGIVAGKSGNNFYVELDKQNDKSLYTFAQAIENVRGSGLSEAYDVAAGLFTNSRRNGLYRVNNKGEEERVDTFVKSIFNPNAYHGKYNTFDATKGLIAYVNDLKEANDRILDGGTMPISNIAIAEPTPYMAELAMAIANDPENASKYKTQYTAAKEQFNRLVKGGIDLTQAEGYFLNDETNRFEEMTSEQRKDYTALLKAADEKDIIPSIVRDPITGGVAIQITLGGQLKNKDGDVNDRVDIKPITFIAGSGSYEDTTLSAWENDPMWKAGAKVERYYNAKRPMSLTNSEAFTGIDKIKLTANGENLAVVDSKNIPLVAMDKEAATNIIKTLSEWEQIYMYAKAGGYYDTERMNNVIEQTADALCKANGQPAIYLDYYKSILNRNIGR